MSLPIILAFIAAGPGLLAAYLSWKSNKKSEETKIWLEKLSAENRLELEALSKNLESKNSLKMMYYGAEINIYPDLMKHVSNYRWIAVEPEPSSFKKDSFDYDGWIERLNNSRNALADYVDENCAFIAKEIDKKIQQLIESGVNILIAIRMLKIYNNNDTYLFFIDKVPNYSKELISAYNYIRDAVRDRVSKIYTDERLEPL